MQKSMFEIVSNTALTESVYKMVLRGDTSAITTTFWELYKQLID